MIRATSILAALLCGCTTTTPADRPIPETPAAPRATAREADRVATLRRQVPALVQRADDRQRHPGEELEALSLLVQARSLAAEYEALCERLGTRPTGVPSAADLERRTRDLARDVEAIFVLFVNADGRPRESREFAGQFVSTLSRQADLRLTLPPPELESYERLASNAGRIRAMKRPIDYLIVARVDAELGSEVDGVFFFKTRANLSVQHVPSGRTVLQDGFPLSEETKYGDPQRPRAAARSLSSGVDQLARVLARDLFGLVAPVPEH